jgi:isocitrate dehydrogenase kinase/phosphatase
VQRIRNRDDRQYVTRSYPALVTPDDTATPDPADIAAVIVNAFIAYNNDFRKITRRARRRFETRDWSSNQNDAVERIELYENSVRRTINAVTAVMADGLRDKSLWVKIKEQYSSQILNYPDTEFFQTYYSSVTRRIFSTFGVDPIVEFIALDVVPTEHMHGMANSVAYRNRGDTRYVFDEILSDYAFATPYRNVDRTIRFISAEVDAYCESRNRRGSVRQIEILNPVFYRATRAYIVGRIDGDDWTSPLVIALKNTDEGIICDSVILSVDDVSMLFGFTRSYFHADLETVGPTVAFLKSMMPKKPVAEIYTVLGRAKQGKTERYRSLFQHLANSTDQFVHARGDKGMVMEVFTLPSYDIVFKVIRDHFAYPKTIGRKDVIDKYQLVFRHDRAGRLVDAQEFRRLRLARARFTDKLLDELLTECSETCRIDGNFVVIEHLYIERRVTPLNLYLREADPEAARQAAIDYGQAIRDLALSNVFPGDLLLKNFGLSRHGRVIFYDYDELCFVTDCNFRRIPEARDEIDEMRAGAWFYVGPNDVFPEQFIQFLGFQEDARQAFLEHHADLLTAEFWANLKTRHESGEVLEVLPYTAKQWTEHRGHALYPTST